MKFTTKAGWRPFHKAEMLRTTGGRWSFNFRAEDMTRLYLADNEDFADEILAGVGQGDLELEVIGYGPVWLRHESEGRVWLRSEEVDQTTVPVYGTVFTEAMTRPQVSEEVRHMQQLMRANQVERDRQMAALMAKLEQVERTNAELARNAGRAGDGEADEDTRRAAPKGGGKRPAGRKAAPKPEVDAEPEAAAEGAEGSVDPEPSAG